MKAKFSSILTLLLAFVVQITFAQQMSVTGTVTDEDGLPLPGVNILVKGTNTGTQSDFDGNYTIAASQGDVLVFSFIGLVKTEQTVGTSNTISVVMKGDAAQLDEVVVTGVAQGTSTAKLGFKVDKVDVSATQDIPTPDAASALRGRVAGAQIVRGSGNPLRNSAIVLRGASTIEGSAEPLIIVDGIITEGGLRDINTEDIASIEVVKGAAASSLYGSQAGNGVIQIITKKGTTEKVKIQLKSEVGFSSLQTEYPSADRHPFEVNADGSFALDNAGNRIPAADGLFDNEFPEYYDNFDALVGSQPYFSNNISLSQRKDNVNYFASIQQAQVEGPIAGLDPYIRQSGRFNIDVDVTEKFSLQFNNSIVFTKGQEATQAGQGGNLFYSLLVTEPFIDLTETDANGVPVSRPTGYGVQGSNFQNPLYVTRFNKRERREKRLLSGLSTNYELTDNLSIQGNISIDRNNFKYQNFYPKGFNTPTPNANLNNGSIFVRNAETQRINAGTQLNYNKEFGDFELRSSARYLFEDVKYASEDAGSSNFITAGTVDLGAGTENVNINSFRSREKTQNYFLTADIDWMDKLIIGGLVRTDRSSLFGENNRDQVFYRGSFAYRLGEDLDEDWIDELKFRASYGTAGLRPSFGDIFETFIATESNISANGQVGNPDLKSPTIKELELGIDFNFLRKYKLSLTYADSKTEDALLTVPLSAAVQGSTIKRNLGETEYKAYELSFSGSPITTDKFSWNFGVTLSKTENNYLSLGGRAPFTRTFNDDLFDSAPALNVFRVEQGLPYGTIFGNQVASSLSDLEVVDGVVINEGLGLPIDAFTVNSDGFVVVEDNIGTADEQVVRLWNSETGQASVEQIGDTNPDFNAGFTNTLRFGNLSLNFLIDWQQGGDVYNYTKQLLYFNDRHADQVTFANNGKNFNYSNAASRLYNRGQAIDYFVEDATFVKVRELSLSYFLGDETLSNAFIDSVKFTVSGRNLFTFTDYTGYDPEVSVNGSPIFKFDEFSYPNFRTFVGSVQITF